MKNQILRLSATEAAREFSRLLDHVESGGEALIERHSAAIAAIGPAATAPRRISECLAVGLARPSTAVDPGFARHVKEIVRGHRPAEFPSWE